MWLTIVCQTHVKYTYLVRRDKQIQIKFKIRYSFAEIQNITRKIRKFMIYYTLPANLQTFTQNTHMYMYAYTPMTRLKKSLKSSKSTTSWLFTDFETTVTKNKAL